MRYKSKPNNTFSRVLFWGLMLFITIYLLKYLAPEKFNKYTGGVLSVNENEIRNIVKDVIKENPELIVSSFENMQIKKAQEAKVKLGERKGDIENSDKLPFIGNPDAKITITKFFDYACGYCKRADKTMEQLVAEDKDIKVIYRELPILGTNSLNASKAALAIYNINSAKYNQFHKELMNVKNIDMQVINKIATNLGVPANKLASEMNKQQVIDSINVNQKLAHDIGVHGTPAFIINGELIAGAIDIQAFKQKINTIKNNKNK